VVREFEVSPTATMITNYDASTDGLGMAGAERLASVLRAYGHDAVAVAHDGEGTGDLEVTARITRIDGGNRGKRILVSQLSKGVDSTWGTLVPGCISPPVGLIPAAVVGQP
jgi:hypothetical protein